MYMALKWLSAGIVLCSASASAMGTSVILNSGKSLPVVGLGVYQSRPGGETFDAVLSALKAGYRYARVFVV
jgi:hypothetical protein